MNNLYIILLVFAFVCSVLAAFNIGAPRWNLIAAALAFYFAALIFGGTFGRHSSASAAREQIAAIERFEVWPDGTKVNR